jgi:hypothetical protein
MNNATRSIVLAVLGVMLLPLSACRRAGPPDDIREMVISVGDPTQYLECPHIGPVPTPVTGTLAAPGDSVHVGGHSVVRRGNADAPPITVTLSVDPSDTVGVEVDAQPPGALQDRLEINIDTSRCQGVAIDPPVADTLWHIWRMQTPGQHQRLRTQFQNGRKVTDIESTSRFLIAM